MPTLKPAPITTLTITNPLVLYRALLQTKRIEPDQSQYRLAVQLQSLYFRLKDYSPESRYGAQLKGIRRPIHNTSKNEVGQSVASPGHPLRRNPLFAHLFSVKERRDTLALTRVLTSYESAMSLDSPRGLLLHGEVGTGKSMLLDLLADCLPNRKKIRWHFNTFMLETMAKLEQNRVDCARRQSEHSLLWLAEEMIEQSPILFLDEFQLPDRATSKILSNLLTPFFHLGGVLIASSNRMPDDLSKASGMDFISPPKGGLVRNLLRLTSGSHTGNFPADNEYAEFVDVLKARCEIWDIQGGRDWRRRESEDLSTETRETLEVARESMIEDFSGGTVPLLDDMRSNQMRVLFNKYAGELNVSNNIGILDGEFNLKKETTPKMYFLYTNREATWRHAILDALSSEFQGQIPWQSTTLSVYGREVQVSRHLAGVTYWSFSDLCTKAYGPADYITLASTFHTLILDEVPVLTISQKNEARRLITLLDALYESRCKLLIRAEAGPDSIFFPDATPTLGAEESTLTKVDANDRSDAVYSETISEVYQDQTSPFRPNISTYSNKQRTDFAPGGDTNFGKGNEIGCQVDFGMTASFTGEDERFAYKRARSRLWEMCGARWHARSDPGWWRPQPFEVRRWEH